MPTPTLGRALLFLGILLVLLGLILSLGGQLPLAGKLPGDFVFQRGRTTVFLPLGTSLALSLIASLLWRLFRP